MDIPAGFKRWRFHWFECPACGHRDWRAFANVTMARQPLRLIWRFWCERCGTYSSLQQPMLPSYMAGVIFLLVGPVSFFFIYRAMLSGLSFESLVLLFGAVWIVQPLVLLGLTRWLYRYVPPG
jgi:hypothetical protein